LSGRFTEEEESALEAGGRRRLPLALQKKLQPAARWGRP
jgi:hypothetical protein